MKEYLFSPGPIEKKYTCSITFSHRDKDFFELYKSIESKLLSFSDYYNKVIFAQGSASSAIETVLGSVLKKDNSKILILNNGSFANRSLKVSEKYCYDISVVKTVEEALEALDNYHYTHFFAVQFETSLSIHNDLTKILERCKELYITSIIDSVSAFPYYKIPECDFLITSSAKQLGGMPVMGIIFFNSDKHYYLVDNNEYLNLKTYIEYSLKYQTPHTSLIPQFLSLNKELETFSVEKNKINIENNCNVFSNSFNFVNERYCPVLTLKVKDTERVVKVLNEKGFKVYYNLFYMKDYIQIGMFNYNSTKPYKLLNKELENLKNENSL